ncbi:nitroreductase family protein [Agromyces larvae]|uniref:Putative NAD(P)H nitroreductase n=1 Tax=Agromyces larvae TaxID=2929802 RepID=A0ABY4C333_9MICO|nr:nitroreductase family protein [Agromyces larvae]UOE45876.1 nitroreductase family protein [Agromyces larvae]
MTGVAAPVATAAGAFEAVRRRRSVAKVTAAAPDDTELLHLLSAAGTVADHAALQPWRVIALRGDARARLGEALADAAGLVGDDRAALAAKPLRAPLLLAVAARRHEHPKVHGWEQDAVAAGVAHTLSLLLDEAGWGVMWRTGPHVRTEPVAAVHGLAPDEHLLGWLYVGGVPEGVSRVRHRAIDAAAVFTSLA